MKRTNFLLLFFVAGFIPMLGLLLLSNKDAKDNTGDAEDGAEIYVQGQLLSQQIRSAPIPDRVDFCGETVVLDRLDLRERFDREINSFAYLHATTQLYLKRANRYFPILEPILKENNIPDDFKYLCVIESNLDTRALSTASAAGLWQLLQATGRELGLEISAEVDERYHIEKATRAACRYLKDAYSKYGSWIDAAASYNGGMGRISAELSTQQAGSSLDLTLVSETSRYMFRIMAIKQLFENPYSFGFILQKTDLYPQVPVKKIKIDKTIENLAEFAREHGLNYMQLKDYNTWLRGNKLTVRPGKTYEIAVPAKEDLFFDPNKIKVHDERWISENI